MTKQQAKKIANLYVASQIFYKDGFSASNLQYNDCNKINEALNEIAQTLIKDIEFDTLPITSDCCVDFVLKDKYRVK